MQYDLQLVIDSLNNNGLIQSFIGPMYGPSKKLLEMMNFPEPVSRGIGISAPVQNHVHIQNIQGSNNVVTGQNSDTKIERKGDKPKGSYKEIRNGVIYTLIIFYHLQKFT